MRAIWVNGQRVDEITEDEMMKVRADLGMVFQEGALFDSLTVAENVGYKLYEETDRAAGSSAKAGRRSARVRQARRVHRSQAVRAFGRPAAPRRYRARHDGKPRILLYDEPTTGLDPITATTIDEEIVKLRDIEEVSSILVTHQLRDAFFVATHEAVNATGRSISSPAGPAKLEEAEFMMLKDGLIIFEGTATSCARRRIRTFRPFCRSVSTSCPALAGLLLKERLNASHPLAEMVGTENRHHVCRGHSYCRGVDSHAGRRGRIFLAAVQPQSEVLERRGVQKGSPVRVAGVTVGAVQDLQFVGSDVEMALELREDMQDKVRTTSRATIGSVSLLGEGAVDITASTTGQPIPEGGYVPSEAPPPQLADVTAQANRGIAELTALMQDVRAGKGTVGKLMTDEQLYAELRQFTAAARDVTDGLTSRARAR